MTRHTGRLQRHITVFALSALSIWGLWLVLRGDRLGMGYTLVGALVFTLIAGVLVRPKRELRELPDASG